jgi:hypothetical protein
VVCRSPKEGRSEILSAAPSLAPQRLPGTESIWAPGQAGLSKRKWQVAPLVLPA